ncbi:hypothetical protein [Petroclostridium xylanilyticum]|uniref:hypothetical protein n=1 Tax=Petroclostridium xylanilyticum TaxID=1792311 RepID=UPI001FA8A004|nr:hypothetical protein [Petroclostridium xylanilyticum]
MAIGNVIDSTICNIGFILGICNLISPVVSILHISCNTSPFILIVFFCMNTIR